MTAHLQMDEQGRVLIPQELREALGLRPGEPLDAEVEGGRLVLRPQAAEAQLVEFEGRLVFVGGATITGDPVQDIRDQRLQDLIAASNAGLRHQRHRRGTSAQSWAQGQCA